MGRNSFDKKFNLISDRSVNEKGKSNIVYNAGLPLLHFSPIQRHNHTKQTTKQLTRSTNKHETIMPKATISRSSKKDTVADKLNTIKKTQFYKIVVNGYNNHSTYNEIYKSIKNAEDDEKRGVSLQKIFGVCEDCEISEDGDDFRLWYLIQNESLLQAVDLDINSKLRSFKRLSPLEKSTFLDKNTNLSQNIMKKIGLVETM